MKICCALNNQESAAKDINKITQGIVNINSKKIVSNKSILSYSVKPTKNNFNNYSCEEVILYHSKYNLNANFFPWIKESSYRVKNKNGEVMIVTRIQNLNSKGNYNIIYFSDLKNDLGHIYSFLIDLCTQLKIDVWAYEYTHKTDSSCIKNDIITLSEFISKFTLKETNFILIGHSVGSIAAIFLASFSACEIKIEAVVLISPISLSSGENFIHSVNKKNSTYEIEKLKSMSCFTFLIHGKKDTHTKYINTVKMARCLQNSCEWYPKKGDHRNIISKYRTKLYVKLKFFIQQIEVINMSRNKKSPNKNDMIKGNFSPKTPKNFTLKFEENFIIIEDKHIRDRDFLSEISGKDCFESLWENRNREKVNRNLINNLNDTILMKSTRSSIKSIDFPFEKKEDI